MDNDHFGGLVMLLTGILIAGMTTLWVFLAYRKQGPLVWKHAFMVTLFVFGWTCGAAMTIGAIYLLSKPETHARHARIEVERREGTHPPQAEPEKPLSTIRGLLVLAIRSGRNSS
jgi:hypothetical protein